MILRIRHKGLRRFYEAGDSKGLAQKHVPRLRVLLAALDVAMSPDDLNQPGFRLHGLGGDLKGFHAVWVDANWRLVFRFEGENATDVDYLDYH